MNGYLIDLEGLWWLQENPIPHHGHKIPLDRKQTPHVAVDASRQHVRDSGSNFRLGVCAAEGAHPLPCRHLALRQQRSGFAVHSHDALVCCDRRNLFDGKPAEII